MHSFIIFTHNIAMRLHIA